MIYQVQKAYYEAVFDTDRDQAMRIIEDAFAKGMSPEDIVFNVVVPSIDLMLTSFNDEFDASIAQHFMATQIAAEVMEIMMSKFKTPPENIGRVIIGASYGDFHGLGKKIVAGCLKTFMIEVFDVGVNVSPERFVDEAVVQGAQVIGISSMMIHTARGENGCLKVRQILRDRYLEDKIKIVVGGAPYRYDHALYKLVQADAWAANGIEAGRVIANLIRGGTK